MRKKWTLTEVLVQIFSGKRIIAKNLKVVSHEAPSFSSRYVFLTGIVGSLGFHLRLR